MNSRMHAASRGGSLRDRMLAAVTLAAIVPVLVLVFVVQRYALPFAARDGVALAVLAASTTIAMAAGALVLWDIGRRLSMLVEDVARRDGSIASCPDQIGALSRYASEAVRAVRQQSREIESLGRRLVVMQEELAVARRKLAS